jgi:hypothetical protein
MKTLKAAALATMIATPSLAGGLAPVAIEPPVIVEETSSSSAGGILVPLLALLLIGAVIAAD